ncbi:ABC transporter permease [Quadrisphaera setariae]|uniref:ABC transporter permease n=1 Tax=Quadrisphaera setariae TaxID=2593304 RepID=UPI00164F9372|nr:ABC transporter permease [Quadrisphaera setariae]
MSTQVSTSAPQPPAAAAEAPPEVRRGLPPGLWQTLGPAAVFVVLFGITAALQPAILSGVGPINLTTQATAILLVALGQAAVLHVGSIDLSNAASAVLGAMVLAKLLGPTAVAAPVLTLVVMALIGAVNGLLVAFTQVPSFALTLGTLGVLQAASLVVSDNTTVYASSNGEVVSWLFIQAFAGLPVAFWFAVVVAVLFWLVLRRTSLGQALTAVGLNETAAVFSGLRTRWLKVAAFSFSGLMAGAAGICIISQAGAASSFGLGSDLLLPGIAAALIGGVAITGGRTNPVGVVFGALTVALVPIAATALGVTPQARSLVYGAVVIAAVALTASRAKGAVVK